MSAKETAVNTSAANDSRYSGGEYFVRDRIY